MIGSTICVIAPLFLALNAGMMNAIGFVVTVSIGEALWSPRIYDYAFEYIPQGKEGLFMALTGAPLFVGVFFTGLSSGFFLEKFCPKFGNCESRSMWFYISLFSLISPVLLLLLKKWLEMPCIHTKMTQNTGKQVEDDNDDDENEKTIQKED
jgi:hypothetical protein